jgi:triosephosphate isomerase
MSQRRKPLIAGNWKMHGSLDESRALVEALRSAVGSTKGAAMLVCPPHPYLHATAEWLTGSKIALGAQDLSQRRGSGAYTGEVSGRMLRDVGCEYVIVGHSERRSLFGENDAIVVDKLKAAQEAGLTPILCVGETLEERERDATDAVIERQIGAALTAAGVGALARAVIAYEPVWAIGTGKTATPDQAQAVHASIRAMIAARDATIAAGLTILYGGSVKGSNARELFDQPDIDGGLVGGASLSATEFLTIYRSAAE